MTGQERGRAGAGYRESHTDPGKGRSYDEHYRANSWDAMLWEREQRVLERVLEWRGGPGLRALDFACGTGRISAFLRPRVGGLVGLDVSEPMLEQARTKLPGTEFVLGDLTEDAGLLGGRRFDLVTAFRFFVNAEPPLRSAALRAMCDVLAPGGAIVFNVHQHVGSPYVRLVRWNEMRGGRTYNVMSRRDVDAMLLEAGLTASEVFPLGLGHVPKVRLPSGAAHRLEDVLERLPGALCVAEDLVFVAERAG